MDASVEQPPRERLALHVYELIRDNQNSNGLLNGNYDQYLKYCSRRLRRVRTDKSVKFTFGRGKHFQNKTLTAALTKRYHIGLHSHI
jgi:RNA-binding signal recognition particle 68